MTPGPRITSNTPTETELPATSRFFGAGERGADGAPLEGSPNRSGHEAGESFRARAAEEQHTAAERAHAVRTVAGHAVDGADCEMLLAVLGLEATDGVRPA